MSAGPASGPREQDAKRADAKRLNAKASALKRKKISGNVLKLQFVTKDIEGILGAGNFTRIIQIQGGRH